MTNGWIDIKNADMMLIMGGNPAENHPCGFKWAIEAKRQRNAKMIVVDPRFTRTAATADLYVQIRAGIGYRVSGRLINYALENSAIAKEYLVNFTNAAFLIQEDFKLPDEDGAVFRDSTRLRRPTIGRLELSGRGRDRRPLLAGECDLRSDARKSALRVSAAKEAVFALHAGDGGADHRHSEGSVPEGCRSVHLHPQGWRCQESRDGDLRGGLDAAQLRHADYPDRGDAATAAGKRRAGGRWSERAARALEYSGRDGYGGDFR